MRLVQSILATSLLLVSCGLASAQNYTLHNTHRKVSGSVNSPAIIDDYNNVDNEDEVGSPTSWDWAHSKAYATNDWNRGAGQPPAGHISSSADLLSYAIFGSGTSRAQADSNTDFRNIAAQKVKFGMCVGIGGNVPFGGGSQFTGSTRATIDYGFGETGWQIRSVGHFLWRVELIIDGSVHSGYQQGSAAINKSWGGTTLAVLPAGSNIPAKTSTSITTVEQVTLSGSVAIVDVQ